MTFDRDQYPVLHGETIRIEIPCGTFYITLNGLDGRIVEIFGHVSKSGTCVASIVNSICRLLSVALQEGVPIERLIKQLQGNQYEKASIGFQALSCSDAIAKVLRRAEEQKHGSPKQKEV